MGELFSKGVMGPAEYIKTFDISELEQAMIYFARGTHKGKVVVTFENPGALLKVCFPLLL